MLSAISHLEAILSSDASNLSLSISVLRMKSSRYIWRLLIVLSRLSMALEFYLSIQDGSIVIMAANSSIAHLDMISVFARIVNENMHLFQVRDQYGYGVFSIS